MDLPDADTIKALSDAGGWTVLAVFVIAAITFLVTALVKGWFVAGHVYQRELKRADDLQATVNLMTPAMRDLTATVEKAVAIAEAAPPPVRRRVTR